MITYQEYFKPLADGLYLYTTKVDNFIQKKVWHIQCIVEETGGPIDKFKITRFESSLLQPKDCNPCDKILGAQEGAIVRDLVLKMVKQLARHERGINRICKAKVIWPRSYSQVL